MSKITGNVLAGADEFRLTAVEYQPDLAIGRDVSVNPLNPLGDNGNRSSVAFGQPSTFAGDPVGATGKPLDRFATLLTCGRFVTPGSSSSATP